MSWRIFFVSLLMVIGTFGLFLWERLHGADIETARTVAVNTIVMIEIFYLFNTRFLTASSFSINGIIGNHFVWLAVFGVVFFQLLFTYLPIMQHFFSTNDLSLFSWLRILLVGVIVFILVEIEKAVLRKWQPN